MALYAYKAMNTQGRMVFGRLEAINLIDLEMRLKRMELDFITGDPVKQGGLMNRGNITRKEMINFCFHLEQLARAGVSLIESLTDLLPVVPLLVKVASGCHSPVFTSWFLKNWMGRKGMPAMPATCLLSTFSNSR